MSSLVNPMSSDGPRKPGAPPASPASAPPATASGLRRIAWLVLAYASLGLGIAAAFIPGIPSTEFILLSAWAATKSSPRLRAWLERHPVFGAMIHNWRNGRAVSRRSKMVASAMMSLAVVIMFWSFPQHRHWVALAAVCMLGGAAWMWSRPEPGAAREEAAGRPEDRCPAGEDAPKR